MDEPTGAASRLFLLPNHKTPAHASWHGATIGLAHNNPFWLALANKADLAADYLGSVNRAKTDYLVGRTEIVGGDLVVQLPGMLQHQADLQISQSAATRDFNKATVQASGQRDRTLAGARTDLASAKGTWERGLVSHTDTNTTVVKPSLDPPATQTTSTTSTARQLSTLLTGGLVSTQPEQPQTRTTNDETPDPNLEAIPINETPAPIDPPSRPSIPLNIWTGPLPVQAEPAAATLPTEPTVPASAETGFFDWLTGLYADPTTSDAPSSVTPIAPLMGIGGTLSMGMEHAAALQAEIDAAHALEADPEYRQAILEAEEAVKEIDAFAALQEELEGLLGSGKLNQLTPSQFRQLQEVGIFKNDLTTPGRTEPDAAAEIQDSKPWWPGGSHYIIVEYLGRKMVYEFTSEGRTVSVSSPSYPVMNSYTKYSPVVNLVGDFPMWQSNESIWESLIEIPTSQFRWGFAEILYGILPGGASATDIVDGRYFMAGLHFAQDVAETVLIVGKLAKLSKFSKLSRLAAIGERYSKLSKSAYAAIAITELIGAGASGLQAGKDLATGERKSAAINAIQALFGVIGFTTSASAYLEAAEKAAAATGRLNAAATKLQSLQSYYSSTTTRALNQRVLRPISARSLSMMLGRLGMIDSSKVRIVRGVVDDAQEGINYFGFVRRIGGDFVRDRRGRILIHLTDQSLSSVKEAVFTVGHEMKHILEFLAGVDNPSELAADLAGQEFLDWFLRLMRQKG